MTTVYEDKGSLGFDPDTEQMVHWKTPDSEAMTTFMLLIFSIRFFFLFEEAIDLQLEMI